MHDVAPEAAGMSAQRLARVDRHLMERYIEPGKIHGALTAVYRKGHLAHFSPLGMADAERAVPLRDDTIFRIYSMTKPVTSVALMMLYEQGLVQLDDPVHRFIPSFEKLRLFKGGVYPRYLTERPARTMEVRHLLTHTSGLTYGFTMRSNVDAGYRKIGLDGLRYPGTLEESVEALAQLPLEFSPGERWNYSVSTDVCGYLVQLISGRPFETFLRDEIFEPLGMVDTAFHVPDAKLPRFAACYERDLRTRSTKLEDDPQTSPYRQPASCPSGGGGLVSTAHDYLRFSRMLLGRGELDGVRLLSRKTLELMTSNHLPGGQDLASVATGSYSESTYEGVGFGLGFSISLDPARSAISGTPGAFAWGGAASTAFWVDPGEEMVVVFLTQLRPSRTFNFRGQLRQIIYGAIID